MKLYTRSDLRACVSFQAAGCWRAKSFPVHVLLIDARAVAKSERRRTSPGRRVGSADGPLDTAR
jgi:hypothetical protein